MRKVIYVNILRNGENSKVIINQDAYVLLVEII